MRSISSAIMRLVNTCLFFACATWATAGFGRDLPAPIDAWGNFGTETALCQRAISRAATLCATRALQNRNACLGSEIAGDICDHATADPRLDAVHERALRILDQYCDQPQLEVLRFTDLATAKAEIAAICRATEIAATSAFYGPAMAAGAVSAVAEPDQTCIAETARAGTKLLRYALRARRSALDRIAATSLETGEKKLLLARAEAIIDRVTDRLHRYIAYTCPDASFQAVYGRDIASFLNSVALRSDCWSEEVYAVEGAGECPEPQCGNGIQEAGEECDDGNDFEGDSCRGDCKRTQCDAFANTYDLIQRAIFENRGCTEEVCHAGDSPAGGLDLRAGVSYANLIDVAAESVPGLKRVDPGTRANSLLWINLAAKTLPNDFDAPLRAMPLGDIALTPAEVEALRLWIETGGASRTGTVPGTAELLDACLPEPEPIAIQPLPPPAHGTGIQLHMPPWILEPNSESEVCFTSYYDLTGQVPAQYVTEDGQRFRYKTIEIRQDPLSHHLIVDIHRGIEGPNDAAWGTYYCRGGEHDREICDPLDPTFCGDADCATDPDHSAIACIGFGPTAGFGNLTSGGLAFAQETTALFTFPAGVYDEVPLKGNVLWNSHAFNHTRRSGKLEGWVNIYFPEPGEEQYRKQQIFNVSKIFWREGLIPIPLVTLEPFEEFEVCNVNLFGAGARFSNFTLRSDELVHIFEISGHMHEHGNRFQIFRGMFLCEGGGNDGDPCSPYQPEMCPAGTCRDVGGRDPDDALLYTNFIYNDPVVLRFPDPLVFAGDAAPEDRSLSYCAHYDNGVVPNIQRVKRRSTSPPAGSILGFSIGGPCAISQTRCIGGPHHNELCRGDQATCDSEPDAGDGDCDACPLTGGFRTQDEMFILFGNFWVD